MVYYLRNRLEVRIIHVEKTVRLAQSPRRLQLLAASAVLADDGVHGTIAHLHAMRRLGFTPHAAGCGCTPCASMTYALLRTPRLSTPCSCWIEHMSRQHTPLLHIRVVVGGDCRRPTYERHTSGSLSIGTAGAPCPRPIYRADRGICRPTRHTIAPRPCTFYGCPKHSAVRRSISQSPERSDTKNTVRRNRPDPQNRTSSTGKSTPIEPR